MKTNKQINVLHHLIFSDVVSRKARRVRVTLLLSIAYSANIGGTGTLIGSTPQLALKGIVEEYVIRLNNRPICILIYSLAQI